VRGGFAGLTRALRVNCIVLGASGVGVISISPDVLGLEAGSNSDFDGVLLREIVFISNGLYSATIDIHLSSRLEVEDEGVGDRVVHLLERNKDRFEADSAILVNCDKDFRNKLILLGLGIVDDDINGLVGRAG